jgi:hypothetical protein
MRRESLVAPHLARQADFANLANARSVSIDAVPSLIDELSTVETRPAGW